MQTLCLLHLVLFTDDGDDGRPLLAQSPNRGVRRFAHALKRNPYHDRRGSVRHITEPLDVRNDDWRDVGERDCRFERVGYLPSRFDDEYDRWLP